MVVVNAHASFSQADVFLGAALANTTNQYLVEEGTIYFLHTPYDAALHVEWSVGWDDYRSVFLGDALELSNDGVLLGGIINAYTESTVSAVPIPQNNYDLQGLTIDALALAEAAQTGSSDDDATLLISALSGNDTFNLSDEADTAFGSGGRDKMYGKAGGDSLEGGAGKDKLFGGNGRDLLVGGAGDDRLLGGNHNDTLQGNSGRDLIRAGKGADEIIGGYGADKLYAGSDNGQDRFVYTSFNESKAGVRSYDTIFQFDRGEDVIDLRMIDANEVWIASDARGSVVLADVTGDGVEDFMLLVANVDDLRLSDLDF